MSLTKSSVFLNKPSYFAKVLQLTLPGNLEHLEIQIDQLKTCVLFECGPERDEVEVRAWQTRVSWLVLEERDLHESLKLPKPGGERAQGLEAVGMAPSPKTPAHQASQPHKVAKVLYLDQGGA